MRKKKDQHQQRRRGGGKPGERLTTGFGEELLLKERREGPCCISAKRGISKKKGRFSRQERGFAATNGVVVKGIKRARRFRSVKGKSAQGFLKGGGEPPLPVSEGKKPALYLPLLLERKYALREEEGPSSERERTVLR